MTRTNKAEDELIEKFATIEHERWSDWQGYVHSKLTKQMGMPQHYSDGMLMSPEDYQHWEEQIAADYDELSEPEKQSDRDQVMRYWPLVQAYIEQQLDNQHNLSRIMAYKDVSIKAGSGNDVRRYALTCADQLAALAQPQQSE